jgi:hypothetical protein
MTVIRIGSEQSSRPILAGMAKQPEPPKPDNLGRLSCCSQAKAPWLEAANADEAIEKAAKEYKVCQQADCSAGPSTAGWARRDPGAPQDACPRLHRLRLITVASCLVDSRISLLVGLRGASW